MSGKIVVPFLLVFSLLLSSCGTILKPYQINKVHSDRLDMSIVVLDALGLLFFIIPGVVAFTVDYINGTLYLASGKYSLTKIDANEIYKILSEEGYKVTLEDIQVIMKENNL